MTTFAYFVGVIVIMIVSGLAQAKVRSAYKKYSRMPASSGMTGAEAAMEMLSRAGVYNVSVEQARGFLSDHFDSRKNVIRLSPEVYQGRSVTAVGIACHEAGHALQQAHKYAPLVIRNMAVPMASFGSGTGFWMVLIGAWLGLMQLAILGLVLFGTVVVFQLVNLPVEFNASARAKRELVNHGIISRGPEQDGVNAVLNAAAMTYVAATAMAVWQFLYFALMIFGGRR